MYILSVILEKNDCHDVQILNLRIFIIVFFLVLGPQHVCLDTKIVFYVN